METLLLVLTILGLLGSGVIGGVFFSFSSFVMNALDRLPAEQGLPAMQSINIVVINWHFLGAFMGTAAISVGGIVLACVRWEQPGTALIAAGGIFYLVGTFLVTMLCNVPLNEALAKLTPSDAGSEDHWRRYVKRWTLWNHVRTTAAVLAALLFSIGLVYAGGAG